MVSVLWPHYKLVTIVNDDSSITNKWSSKLIDNARVIFYDRNRFIIQATELHLQASYNYPNKDLAPYDVQIFM